MERAAAPATAAQAATATRGASLASALLDASSVDAALAVVRDTLDRLESHRRQQQSARAASLPPSPPPSPPRSPAQVAPTPRTAPLNQPSNYDTRTDSNPENDLEVQVPDGLSAGDSFEVHYNGLSFPVVVPEGCGGGTLLTVDVPTADDRPIRERPSLHVEAPAAREEDEMQHAPAHRDAPAFAPARPDGGNSGDDERRNRSGVRPDTASRLRHAMNGSPSLGFSIVGRDSSPAGAVVSEVVEAVRVEREANKQERLKQEVVEMERAERARINRAELDKVKAMTMHEMIEELISDDMPSALGGRAKKLLFLTHEQAELMATNSECLGKMLEAFDVGKPQLVINLLESGGFGDWTRQRTKDGWSRINTRWAPGVRHGKAPFLTAEDERAAEYRIDLFMSDILIPLAVQTHAVVICCAIPSLCILSASFTRMFQAVKAKWTGKPPFTVLSTTNDMLALYSSKKYPENVPAGADWGSVKDSPLTARYQGTFWRKVMEASLSWKDHHASIAKGLDVLTENPLEFDLDNNAETFVIVNDGGRGTFAMLIKALTRHLAANLPSLAIKTGCSRKRPLGMKDPSTLEVAADSAISGTPTLFLDVRPVKPEIFQNVKSRDQLVQRARNAFTERNRALVERGMCDTLDACALAYFHEMLVGDGDPTTEELTGGKSAGEEPTPIHRAIAVKLRQKRKKVEKVDSAGRNFLVSGNPTRSSMSSMPSMPSFVRAKTRSSFDSPKRAPTIQIATPPATSSPSSIPSSRRFSQRLRSPGTSKPTEEPHEPVEEPDGDVDVLEGAVARVGSLLNRKNDEYKYVEKWTDEPASLQQTVALSDWFTETYFNCGWNVLDDIRERTDVKGESFEVQGRQMYRNEMLAMSVACRTLLSSENFYHINLTQHATAKRLVAQLVQLDRLPRENTLESLQLLRSAWRDYDVAMLLAGRYKRMCKLAYILQLLLGWLAIALASVADADIACAAAASNTPIAWLPLTCGEEGCGLVHAVFAVSVAMTLVIAADSILHSHSRWRHLRIGAGALESVIWKYRTRTGAFEVDETGGNSQDPHGPEEALLRAVRSTRQIMLASANLATSELGKKYPLTVYKHLQDRGEPKAIPRARMTADADARHTEETVKDDFQSPTQPTKYIALRIEPAMAFYQKRIPRYARRAALLKLLVAVFGIAASVLARYEETLYVVLVTAFGAAITSWSEFSDTQRKTERYTRCVHALRDLLDWWRCLGEVEKASKPNINRLVQATEMIINEEQTAWTSTPQGDKAEEDDHLRKAADRE